MTDPSRLRYQSRYPPSSTPQPPSTPEPSSTPRPPSTQPPPAVRRRRRYPRLITFHNGRPIPHPLPHAPLHYAPLPVKKRAPGMQHRKAQLPRLKAQPAINEDAENWTKDGDGRSRSPLHCADNRSAVAKGLPARSVDDAARRAFIVASRRMATWLHQEDVVLAEGYRKFGNDWMRIAKLLSGRSPHAVRNRFYKRIRDQHGFRKKRIATCQNLNTNKES